MRIQTLSIVAGSEACNARCPFCISKMTPPNGVALKEPAVNWRNFRKACVFAAKCGVTTVMITGKGEPTLFPNQIAEHLAAIQQFEFPFIELQTNGIKIADEKPENLLSSWYEFGLSTIAISISHYDAEKNRQIYLPHRKTYIDLPGTINFLHNIGFSVRLSCVMLNEYIDSVTELENLIGFAKLNRVEQLSVRPVNQPASSMNEDVREWAIRHNLSETKLDTIKKFLAKQKLLMTHAHGAQVFDVNGQNVCLTDSLTINGNSEDLRQLIFFPDGHLRYDWQYAGAILL